MEGVAMSTIRTVHDVNRETPAVVTGDIHSRSRLLAHRWFPAVAPVLALFYPSCVTLLERTVEMVRRPGGAQAPLVWIALLGAIALVCAVPVGSLIVGHVLGNARPLT